MRHGGDAGDYARRETARAELKYSRDGFKTLDRLRNALAHGVRPSDRNIERAVSKEENLRKTLKSLLTQLVGESG